jgi:dienelactone hydrolase
MHGKTPVERSPPGAVCPFTVAKCHAHPSTAWQNEMHRRLPYRSELLKKVAQPYEPVIHEGAGHGFMRAGEDPAGSEPNKRARGEAWQRLKEILERL